MTHCGENGGKSYSMKNSRNAAKTTRTMSRKCPFALAYGDWETHGLPGNICLARAPSTWFIWVLHVISSASQWWDREARPDSNILLLQAAIKSGFDDADPIHPPNQHKWGNQRKEGLEFTSASLLCTSPEKLGNGITQGHFPVLNPRWTVLGAVAQRNLVPAVLKTSHLTTTSWIWDTCLS